jgi:hypothetical protein
MWMYHRKVEDGGVAIVGNAVALIRGLYLDHGFLSRFARKAFLKFGLRSEC